jgi:hypothetical protein
MLSLLFTDRMDRLIRNLDPGKYRALKSRAAAEGRAIGEVINEAIGDYLSKPVARIRAKRKRGWLSDLPQIDFGPGSEDWSERIDEILYGDES